MVQVQSRPVPFGAAALSRARPPRVQTCRRSVLGLACLLGCGGRTLDDADSLGQLALRLSAVSAKAEDYLLTAASFHYSGASEGSFSIPEGDASFRTILPVGEYGIELLDGWRLQRDSAEGLVPIAAELTSSNPALFSILPSQVSPLAFQFKTGAGLVSGEGVLELSVGVDDSEDDTAGNGCPNQFCGPLTVDFEDQPAATVISDQYADYLTFSTRAAAPVVVHVVEFAGGHSVCADPAATSQCHFELDITFTRPVESLSLAVVNSSTTFVTHALGIESRTVLSTSLQSFADLHEVTRIQSVPIGPLGSIRSLTFSVLPRLD
jgi:hypothetical protein